MEEGEPGALRLSLKDKLWMDEERGIEEVYPKRRRTKQFIQHWRKLAKVRLFPIVCGYASMKPGICGKPKYHSKRKHTAY